MIKIATFVLFLSVSVQIYAQDTGYQKNLEFATDLFIAQPELPDSVLLKLVPDSHEEFRLLYGTTYPGNKMQSTEFFYDVTQQIFDKVIIGKNEQFYLPGIQLASFADGEFGESFVDNLEIIIALDINKFCTTIRGKEFAEHNPVKSFAEQYDCK